MKKSKKEFKPSYIVDLDEIKCLEDIPAVWAFAKQEAGLPLTNEEFIDILRMLLDEVTPKITVIYECDCKTCDSAKKPWYKRFWNWLTRKN